MNALPPEWIVLATVVGKAAFILLFVLLMGGILWLPSKLLEASSEPIPPYKNIRWWAIAIIMVQITVYWIWG